MNQRSADCDPGEYNTWPSFQFIPLLGILVVTARAIDTKLERNCKIVRIRRISARYDGVRLTVVVNQVKSPAHTDVTRFIQHHGTVYLHSVHHFCQVRIFPSTQKLTYNPLSADDAECGLYLSSPDLLSLLSGGLLACHSTQSSLTQGISGDLPELWPENSFAKGRVLYV